MTKEAIEAIIEFAETYPDLWELLKIEEPELISGLRKALEHDAVPVNREHDFYKTGDDDAPSSIKDRNGEVVLQWCRKCGQAESEIQPDCPAATVSAEELAKKLHNNYKKREWPKTPSTWSDMGEAGKKIWINIAQDAIDALKGGE